MSDSEHSDSIDDLQDILDEYDAKAKAKSAESSGTPVAATKTLRPVRKNIEVPMDRVIFGDKEGLIKRMTKAVGEDQKGEEENNDEDEEDYKIKNEKTEQDASESDTQNTKKKASKRKPVWTDADDEKIQLGEIKRETKHTGPLDHLKMDRSYKDYLTARFTNIMPQPKWANLDKKSSVNDGDEDDDDDELLRTVGFVAKPTAGTLKEHHIQIKRMKDLNRATYKEGNITSICFHPTSTAALVAGDSGIATIYSIDGDKNEKLHSIGFQNFPILCAQIAPCGTKAYFGSNRRFFYSYDLLSAQELRHNPPRKITKLNKFVVSSCGRYLAAAGRFGELHLFDANSKELIHTYKQENQVAAMCFTGDSSRIITSSNSNDVTVFSVRSQRVEHTFFDEGCIKGSVIDLAPNQRLLATGSREGVVNVYDVDKVFVTKTPLPEKSIMNLTTPISAVRFNHSSELLAMSSGVVRSAVKLVHFPTCTVYANFPNFNADLDKVGTVAFSPSSGYLALGNRRKEVPLFRLKHFKNY